jgi:hypothetical protein
MTSSTASNLRNRLEGHKAQQLSTCCMLEVEVGKLSALRPE